MGRQQRRLSEAYVGTECDDLAMLGGASLQC